MTAALVLPAHLAGRTAFRPRDLDDAFGLTKRQVHRLIRNGELEAVKLDGCVLIPRASVEAYLATARPVEKK